MRKIDTIILHCTATPVEMEVNADVVREWHTSPPRSWSDIGYHFVIDNEGRIEVGRPLDKVGAHAKGHNTGAVGIAYAGGVDSDGEPCNTMNRRQRAAIVALVRSLRMVLGRSLSLIGHNDVTDKKACPSFRVGDEFADLVQWLAAYDAR